MKLTEDKLIECGFKYLDYNTPDKKIFNLGHSLNGKLPFGSINGYYVPNKHIKLINLSIVDMNKINELQNMFNDLL